MRHTTPPSDNPFIRRPKELLSPLSQRDFLSFDGLPQTEHIKVDAIGVTVPLKDYLGAVAQQTTIEHSTPAQDEVATDTTADRLTQLGVSERRPTARAYLTDARAVNRRLGLPAVAIAGTSQEESAVRNLAGNYCKLNKASLLNIVTTETGLPQLAHHLESNLTSLLMVRHTITRCNLNNKLSGELAEKLLPDFFQLDTRAQWDIVNAFGREWQELFRTMRRYDLLGESLKIPQRWPLAHSAMKSLRGMMERHAALGPATVCELFLQQPHTYADTLGRMKKEREQRIAAYNAALTEKMLTPAEVHQDIQRLMDNPKIDMDIIKLRPGKQLAIGERDTALSGQTSDELIYNHLRLLGQVRYARDMMTASSRNVATEDEPLRQAGARLRNNYDGILQNITISYPSRVERERKGNSQKHATGIYIIEAELAQGQAAGPIRLWVQLGIKPGDHEQVCDAITWSIVKDEISPATENYMKRAAETVRRQSTSSRLLGDMTIREVIEGLGGADGLN